MKNAQTTLAALASFFVDAANPGRENATRGSLNQVGEIAGDLPLSLPDCAAGFAALAKAKAEGEPGNVVGRRKTCGELAVFAGDSEGGNVANLAAVFRAVETHFASSDDPRQKAMAGTAKREADELEASAQ
jgi:hypothetical protein